ncbi:hypothetical protein DE146DRAFT_40612 [Phaeosphaeria sp. MPI-PUGE-AT-0046c]|nr:hypothetical protein DE146DRAFT_40612 [Phaeosphaeria sp. MPI-PUGE-AT-0046c]
MSLLRTSQPRLQPQYACALMQYHGRTGRPEAFPRNFKNPVCRRRPRHGAHMPLAALALSSIAHIKETVLGLMSPTHPRWLGDVRKSKQLQDNYCKTCRTTRFDSTSQKACSGDGLASSWITVPIEHRLPSLNAICSLAMHVTSKTIYRKPLAFSRALAGKTARQATQTAAAIQHAPQTALTVSPTYAMPCTDQQPNHVLYARTTVV